MCMAHWFSLWTIIYLTLCRACFGYDSTDESLLFFFYTRIEVAYSINIYRKTWNFWMIWDKGRTVCFLFSFWKELVLWMKFIVSLHKQKIWSIFEIKVKIANFVLYNTVRRKSIVFKWGGGVGAYPWALFSKLFRVYNQQQDSTCS